MPSSHAENLAYMVWGALYAMTRADGVNTQRTIGKIDPDIVRLVLDASSANGAIEAALAAKPYDRVTCALRYLRELEKVRLEELSAKYPNSGIKVRA